VATPAPAVLPPARRDEPLAAPPPPWLRQAVRDLLERSTGYQGLATEGRRALARAMVQISTLAAHLISEELAGEICPSAPRSTPVSALRPLARAQDAPGFAAAADRVASTTRNVLNAVSFPRFVTDLINGVFRAMLDSSSQQMNMYVELLNNVSASLDGFANTQFSLDAVRRSLVDRFPDQFELEEPEVEPGDEPPDPDDLVPPRLRLRSGAAMPTADEIRAALGMAPAQTVEVSNPEQLVPLARRQLARQRQQMLATMVMMGMQRIVVESGRIHASMRFHVDTHSAANAEQGSTFDLRNRVRAGGRFGFGPWGASADIENTVGYVSTQRSQSSEELNTDLELNSSVEINFRSDYLPLNRMTGQDSAERIRANALNPEAETAAAAAERRTRDSERRAADQARLRAMDSVLAPQAPQLSAHDTPVPIPVSPGGGSTTSGSSRPSSAGTTGGSSTTSGSSGSSSAGTTGGSSAGTTSGGTSR